MNRNRLLAALPEVELDRLTAELTVVDLKPHKVLYEPHEPVHHVYFPLNLVISLISLTKEGETVEIGMVGNEGLAGAAVLLGADTIPYRAIVQTGGKAARLEIGAARKFFSSDPVIQKLLLRYIHILLTQTAQSVICSRFHSLEQRVARWLLATQDRAGDEAFPYTHEFVSTMLGARRVSVTLALGVMERKKIIETTRGKIRIVDRGKLEKVACECYFIVRHETNAFLAEIALHKRTN
jgi:cAMP-binding proteins - catabolite gene activator and regulatory subunit of cAMP-dependent protein kinases